MSSKLDIPIFESDTCEFKTCWTETAKKAISAFLNSSGGTIYFGVNDDGTVLGIPKDNVDKLLNTIAVVSRQGFQPAADSFIRTRVHEIEGKYIVVATILAGALPPYYATIKNEGTRAYIRRGPACFEITDEERRELIRRSDTRDWDCFPSSNQTLTFKDTQKIFKEQNVDFIKSKYPILGIIDSNGFYTNLGFLLSDQCNFETRIGFFNGLDKTVKDRDIISLSGSILEQVKQAMEILNGKLGFSGQIKNWNLASDGTRQEVPDYPFIALREALVNTFAHRDYSTGLQTFISVFSNRIEIFSYGGLPKGVLESQLEEGVSACRNEHLANLFFRLGLMERYGLGIPSMFAAYKPYGLRPEIKVDSNRILIVLPKLGINDFDPSTEQGRICIFLQQKGECSRSAIQSKMGWSVTKTTYLLNSLLDQKTIERVGTGRNTVYRLKA